MRNPEEIKLMVDCECGRSVNKAYVEKVIDKIVTEAVRKERERIIKQIKPCSRY